METAPKIHLCFVAYEYLDRFSSASDLLDDFFSLTDIAEALLAEGVQVSAVVRFKADSQIERNGVSYHFVADSYGPQLKFWQIPERVHQVVHELQPTVVHTHNMNKMLQHNHLVDIVGPEIPLVVQNHAEWPAKWLRMSLQRRLFPKLSAFLFCAPGQEKAWREKQLIQAGQTIHYVMEGSTTFQYSERALARKKTGLTGSPIFLWVGNLDSNKDPLCVLEAFQNLLLDYPEARLYMIYRFEQLLEEVRAFLRTSTALYQAVVLLGEKERAGLEDYYNSADYYVLGSHREGSGYSLMEALACGCVPVVTDIPSFRMMTKEGQIGALWRCGDWESALGAMKTAVGKSWSEQSQHAQRYFVEQLSNPAIARQLKSIYLDLLAAKSS